MGNPASGSVDIAAGRLLSLLITGKRTSGWPAAARHSRDAAASGLPRSAVEACERVKMALEAPHPERRQEPVEAGIKKPIPGRPEIGAHFMSFNFLNRPFR